MHCVFIETCVYQTVHGLLRLINQPGEKYRMDDITIFPIIFVGVFCTGNNRVLKIACSSSEVVVKEPPQKCGVCLLGSRSGDSQ
jgi:hypothetical protein